MAACDLLSWPVTCGFTCAARLTGAPEPGARVRDRVWRGCIACPWSYRCLARSLRGRVANGRTWCISRRCADCGRCGLPGRRAREAPAWPWGVGPVGVRAARHRRRRPFGKPASHSPKIRGGACAGARRLAMPLVRVMPRLRRDEARVRACVRVHTRAALKRRENAMKRLLPAEPGAAPSQAQTLTRLWPGAIHASTYRCRDGTLVAISQSSG